MSEQNVPWKALIAEEDELKFDTRLVEKKIEAKFLTHEEVKKFKDSIPEENEFDFTSAEELDAQEDSY